MGQQRQSCLQTLDVCSFGVIPLTASPPGLEPITVKIAGDLEGETPPRLMPAAVETPVQATLEH